jgi:PAS domain S-box-containing protein
MDMTGGIPTTEESKSFTGTRRLTVGYLLILGVLGALAVGNYLILRAQIETSRSTSAVFGEAGGQRSLLQESALLAQKLIVTTNPKDRTRVRAQLHENIASLETTRHILLRDKSGSDGLPKEVRAIYFDPPWLLDSQMRKYIAELHALADAPDKELDWSNPHVLFIYDAAMSGRMVDALNNVVSAYRDRDDQKSVYLLWLAIWSAGSTIVVLVLSGLLVFRPLVRHVKHDMDMLQRFSEILEQRVTERTALAEQRAGALVVSEALYHSLVDHLPLHVNRKDLHGRFTFVNDSFCQFLGKTRNDILGNSNFDFFPVEIAQKYLSYDTQVVEQGRIVQSLEQLRAADGSLHHMEMLKTPVRSASGEIVETQTVYLDVTDRVETERKLAQSERLAEIGKMVAGVAHESRNALQQMQACSGLLKWKINDDKETQDLLADLQKAQDRLHRLFEDLLGYSAPQTLNIQVCDLHNVVDDAWATLAQTRDGSNAILHKSDSKLDVRCRADHLRLEQVFRNIMENSLEARVDHAAIEVDFAQAALRGRPAVAITVRDNGPGFTQDQRQQAFEPFYTTKTEGTGLGLAIIKRIIEAHEGEIELGNRLPQGAEIRITLPKGNV